MRKKKFSKERFYRRLEAQNKNNGYVGFDTAHPQGDYSVIIDPDAWKDALERAGKALGQWCAQVNKGLKPLTEYLASDEGKAAFAKAFGKKPVKPEQVNDWDVMQSGYQDCQIYPDFRSNMEADLIRNPLYSKRRSRGGFVEHESMGFDESFQQLRHTETYLSAEAEQKPRASGLFFNERDSSQTQKPVPKSVPTPPIKWESRELNLEPGFFVIFICLLGLFLLLGIAETL